jgi:hypothetical protein
MRNGKQAFRSSLPQTEKSHLVHSMAVVRLRHYQWIEENFTRFRE